MSKFLIFVLFWCLGSVLIWVQTNGQFLWSSFEKNPILLSVVFGTIISYIMIIATKYGFVSLNGSLWSIKWVGFSLGIIINALLNFYLMNEGINMKTTISLVLAFGIIAIQLWK
tara:strand:- start:1022 stop:1363 length:342 start_codon:yes stop_codon:yes gene_type:complete